MRIIVLLILLLDFSIGFSQENKIRVVNEERKPISGAVISGNNFRTFSDKNGYFDGSLFVKDSVVTVTHVAYLPLQVDVKKMLANKKIVLRKKIYETNEVKINAKKIIDETSVKIDDKSKSKYSAVADAIRNETPLFIKDYGGYAGLKTVSFRGLSSENTLVLFNEARVNDLRSGAFNFAGIGINSLDEIVFRENYSNGNISSGGVIDLISGVVSVKNTMQVGYSFSSLKSQSFYGKGNYNFGRLSASVNFERSFSPNEFPYKFEGETLRRANAFYSKDFLGGSLIYSGGNFFAKIYLHYSLFNNGLPGFVVSNNTNSSNARTENKQKLLVSNFVTDFGGKVTYKNIFSVNYSTMIIHDNNGDLLINRKEEKAEMNGWVFNNNFSTKISLFEISAGVDLSGDKLQSISPSFLGDIPYSATRFQQNYYFNPKINFGKIFKSYALSVGSSLSYIIDKQKNTDTNSSEDYPSFYSYIQIASEDKRLVSKISYASSFRLPTFTEIYYSEVFTPNKIKAEKYENIAVSFRYVTDEFSAKLSLYNIFGKNKIVWMPTRLALQVPQNVKTIKSSGFELGLKKEIKYPRITLKLIYNFNDVRNLSAQSADDNSYNKTLVYSPKHQIKAGIDFTKGKFFSSVNYTFVSERYYTSDNNPRYVLPLYNVFDFTFGYTFELSETKNTITLNVYNAFNESYFIIQSYPMPLRTIRLNYSLTVL